MRKETRCRHIGYDYQQGFFYKHHPTDRIAHTTAFVTPVVEHWPEREIAQWVHPMKDRSDDHERTPLPRSYISLPDKYEVTSNLQIINLVINFARQTSHIAEVYVQDIVLEAFMFGHLVKDHSDSEKGNQLPPRGLLFLISSKGCFICTIPQTG